MLLLGRYIMKIPGQKEMMFINSLRKSRDTPDKQKTACSDPVK